MSVCVICNPKAANGTARRRLDGLGRRWRRSVCFEATEYPGHAEQLAYEAAQLGYDVVAAAGGDGTAHEVANGLLRADNSDVSFAVLPVGSANDYAYSLDAMGWSDGDVRLVDVGQVRTPGGRQRHFICCLGLGLNGAVTLESRRIDNLEGIALYGLATLQALRRHYRSTEMEVAIDGEPGRCMPTLMLSILVGKREGGFVLAPDACLDDGRLDFVHAGALTRWEVMGFLPRLALAGPPTNHPKVRVGQCRQVRLRSAHPFIVHLDGEFFCLPEDDIRELEVEVRSKALRVCRLEVG